MTIGPSQITDFRASIARIMGLHFDDGKTSFLGEVLVRRIASSKATPAVYLASLEARGTEEIAALAAELTVSETYFFRNMAQFRAYVEVCLPDRVAARSAQRKLRLLSLGCATGEEAYSLSILATEYLDTSWRVSIKGADVNPAVVAKATRGRYSSWALRETSPETIDRWFRVDGKEVVLDETIRKSVQFEARNLVDDDPIFWAPGSADIIFCRNMLMYFTPESARAVLSRVASVLAPGGYLFLGHAETLRGISTDFRLLHTHGTFYYQRRHWLEPEKAPFSFEGDRSFTAEPPTERDLGWTDVIRRASERVESLTDARAPLHSEAPQKPRFDLGEVLAFMHEERFSAALDRLDEISSRAPPAEEHLLLRAVLLVNSGRFQEAEKVATDLLVLDELSSGAHYVVALCREGAGDRKGAIDHHQTAIYLDAAFAMPRLHLGLAARKNGDLETARQELTQALTLLQREDPSRVLFFGGGFNRDALIALCQTELNRANAQAKRGRP